MSESIHAGCAVCPQIMRGDDRGSLVAIEAMRDVPFPIVRVYYLFGTLPHVARGFHAHRALRQFAVCVAGSCNMILDNGRDRTTVRLDDPAIGLMIEPAVWHEMHDFAPGTVLMVLADQPYDESDYIRDYDAFLTFLGNGAVA